MSKKNKLPLRPSFVSHIEENTSNHEANLANTSKLMQNSCFYYQTNNDISDVETYFPLHQGEVECSCVKGMTQYVLYSNETNGMFGNLIITNFRIAFISLAQNLQSSFSWNKLFGSEDIPLTNISNIYIINKNKRKLMSGLMKEEGIIDKIEIHCHNFRIKLYGFENCDQSITRKALNFIYKHSHPSKCEFLFYFNFVPNNCNTQENVIEMPCMYQAIDDYQRDIESFNVIGCIVNKLNFNFKCCSSLPEYFICPNDINYADNPRQLTKNFSAIPMWCYSHQNASMLFRMAITQDEIFMQKALGSVSKISKLVHVFDLTQEDILPSFEQLNASYQSLTNLCMPCSLKEIQLNDGNLLSLLESCGWLTCISQVLNLANTIASMLSIETSTVVIQDTNNTDWTCVISCLVRMLLDPQVRTIVGFQSMLQREWIQQGYQFPQRTGIVPPSFDASKCPLFELFLDCVFQIINQFPSKFQFSEIYLSTLLDSIYVGLFHEFVYKNPKQRNLSIPERNRKMSQSMPNINDQCSRDSYLSVWHWSNQIPTHYLALFYQPLYDIKQLSLLYDDKIFKDEKCIDFNSNKQQNYDNFSEFCKDEKNNVYDNIAMESLYNVDLIQGINNVLGYSILEEADVRQNQVTTFSIQSNLNQLTAKTNLYRRNPLMQNKIINSYTMRRAKYTPNNAYNLIDPSHQQLKISPNQINNDNVSNPYNSIYSIPHDQLNDSRFLNMNKDQTLNNQPISFNKSTQLGAKDIPKNKYHEPLSNAFDIYDFNKIDSSEILLRCGVSELLVWSGRYLRFVQPIAIEKGGDISIQLASACLYIQILNLHKEIMYAHHALHDISAKPVLKPINFSTSKPNRSESLHIAKINFLNDDSKIKHKNDKQVIYNISSLNLGDYKSAFSMHNIPSNNTIIPECHLKTLINGAKMIPNKIHDVESSIKPLKDHYDSNFEDPDIKYPENLCKKLWEIFDKNQVMSSSFPFETNVRHNLFTSLRLSTYSSTSDDMTTSFT